MKKLDNSVFDIHLRICLAKEYADREFEMNVHGIPTGEAAKKTQRVARTKGGGTQREVLKEHIRIDKVLTESDLL